MIGVVILLKSDPNRFFNARDLEIWQMISKNNRKPTSPMLLEAIVCHFIAIREFKLELPSGNAQVREPNRLFFGPCDLKIWRMTLKKKAPLLYRCKLANHFAAICETGVTRLQSGNAQFGLSWKMNLKNNRAFLLCLFKLCHLRIQTRAAAHKRPNWGKFAVTLTFDLWPWHFAWTYN